MLGTVLVVTVALAAPAKIGVLCDDAPALQTIADDLERELEGSGWQVQRLPRGEWQHLCSVDHTESLRLVAEAKNHFYDLKLKSARKLLLAAEHQVSKSLWLETPAELQELYLLLGWLEVEKRKRRPARVWFRKSLQLWPTWRPKHADHPPNVKAAFEAVAAKAKRVRTGRLVLNTPADAKVTLNGFLEQTCPCDLPVGEHFITVSHPEHGRLARKVRIDPGKSLELDLDFARDLRSTWAQWIITGQLGPLQASVQEAGDTVVLLTQASGTATAVIISGGVSRVPLDGARPVAAILAALSAPAEIVTAAAVPDMVSPSSTTAPPAAVETDSESGSRWWLWTAIAIVGAGLAAGATSYVIWRTEDDVRIRIRP